MKAVVLVGGEGTRLRPLTETRPKPLLPFMNRPFLHHVLDHLASHGVEEAVLSSPYLEREFKAFLDERTGLPRVTWITEETPFGTAGAIAGARDHLSETFLVLNGDVLSDLDLGQLVSSHRDRAAAATIALREVTDARPFGLVETDEEGLVRAFREKPSEEVVGTINAGTYVLEPSVLDWIPPGAAVSIERQTFPALIGSGAPVLGVTSKGYWRDLGTPEAYLEAHRDALEGRIGGPYDRPLLDPAAEIDPAARVAELVVVGPGARVARGARVDGSVLHAESAVEAGAEVDRSILGTGSRVGEGARVTDSVLGDGVSIPSGAVLRSGRTSRLS